MSEVAQAAADRGELRLVHQSAQTVRRRRPKALRRVTFPDGSASMSEQDVAGAWLRVFAEQLGGQVAEGAGRDHDGDVEPEVCGRTRVAAAGEGAEWAPSRENIAEAILSVGSNRGVGCDMVPVELPVIECRGFGTAVCQDFSPDTPKTKGSVEKRRVGQVNHTAKVCVRPCGGVSVRCWKRRLCPLRWEGSEGEAWTEHRICRGLEASGGSQRQVSMRLVCCRCGLL